ncbi:CheY chemotaxis protein or a CheY-like REC (receiver) domain [Massilia yuzhufengensis]|uniref:histidine kinase n=1 Tax=Massilia yuzhufengensis TaxID=1164594 RepID=A0A1I1T8N1_9BURK|nr:CheY chemotaxis protein or a CheY-like REC (receiver) domain [Massilia yuzhufengensis]
MSDSGIGIPPHRLDDIFESFTQVDASTTRQYGGTGLGLTISKRLAEIMGGTIKVTSEPGRGSCFTLSIMADAGDGKSSSAQLRTRAAPLAGRRILIVDDNSTNLRILHMQALQWGMQPSAVSSASEALELVMHAEPFEVALVDLHMPDMPGTALAAAIERLRPGVAPPMVLLMPIGERVQAQDGDDVLFAARLGKPVKPAMLLEALLKALGVHRNEAPAPAAVHRADQAGVEILVAEDNAINQKVIQQQLRRLGYQADIVGNGAEAVAALERQHYGVVLMDVQMPVMDGIEATRRLRLRFRGLNVPYIVAMTANALPGDRERCLAAGMDTYLPKPVIFDELRQTLALAIETVTARRSPTAIDPARVQELAAGAMGEDGVLHDVVAVFLQEVPDALEAAAQAIGRQDGEALAATAHYLLTSIGAIGALRMRDPCSRLQMLGKLGGFETAQDALAALAREFEAARAELLVLQGRA